MDLILPHGDHRKNKRDARIADMLKEMRRQKNFDDTENFPPISQVRKVSFVFIL